MNDSFDTLEDVFTALEGLEPGEVQYKLLQGKVYDALRFEVNRHIPDRELANVTLMLRKGEIGDAEDKVREYLEPGELELGGSYQH